MSVKADLSAGREKKRAHSETELEHGKRLAVMLPITTLMTMTSFSFFFQSGAQASKPCNYTAEVLLLHKESYETLVNMVNTQWFRTLGKDVFNDFSGVIQYTLCFGTLVIRMVVFTI